MLQMWETCFKFVICRKTTSITCNITKFRNGHFPTSSCTPVSLEIYFHSELVSQMNKNYFFTLPKWYLEVSLQPELTTNINTTAKYVYLILLTLQIKNISDNSNKVTI